MRKLFHVLLSLVIVYASTMGAYASSPAGWTATASDVVMAGATAAITAFKNKGGQAMKSVISHKPTAVAVGKDIIKGGGVIAVAYAMSKLLDAGVDWVLDPENNRVKYKDGSADVGAIVVPRGYKVGGGSNAYADTAFDACMIYTGGAAADCVDITISSSGSVSACYASGGCRPVATWVGTGSPPVAGDDYKYISMDTVAAKVLANAEAGHADSQDFVKAVAVGAVDAGELDTALDASAVPDSNVDTDNPPTDPSKPYDDSGIKDLLRKILAALAGISAISALLEFFKDEPVEKESKPVDVDVPNPTKAPNEFDVSYVKFGGQCPAMPSFSIDILGASSSMTFDMTPLCNLAVAIRPAIVAIAYFIGLGVIASAIRET